MITSAIPIIAVTDSPTNQIWGTRETGIRDPDGNVLVFAMRQKNINAP